MTEPLTPPPDDKDWTWVVDRPCPDCGFSGVAKDELPDRVRASIAVWHGVLARPEVRQRPEPEVWSPLEYGCHVRDVCRVFSGRVQAMLDTDGARFANWDQDASALEGRYFEADPVTVAREYDEAAGHIANQFAAVQPDQWQRRGLRSNGSAFTVETLGVYFLHDLEHHAWDVSHGER